MATEMGTLSGVNQGAAWPLRADCLRNLVGHQLSAHGLPDRPADDFATIQVDRNRQIRPALSRPQVGDISHPSAVQSADGDLPFEMVRVEDGELADGPLPGPAPMKRPKASRGH
jgi:hypothetical protein